MKLETTYLNSKYWHKQLKNLCGNQKKKGILNLTNGPIIRQNDLIKV